MLGKLRSKLLASNDAQGPQIEEEEKKGEAVVADQENNMEQESMDINFEFSKLNYEILQKKRAYVNGSTNKIMPVMPADLNKKKKKQKFEGFRPIGDVLPIVPRQEVIDA